MPITAKLGFQVVRILMLSIGISKSIQDFLYSKCWWVFDEKLSQKKCYIKTEIVLLESMSKKFDIYKLYIATQPVVRDSETLAFFWNMCHHHVEIKRRMKLQKNRRIVFEEQKKTE